RGGDPRLFAQRAVARASLTARKKDSGQRNPSYCQSHKLLVITAPPSGRRACRSLGFGSDLFRRARPRIAEKMRQEARGMAGKNGAIKLVAGNSNLRLAEAIAAYLKMPLAKAVVRRFADMEIFVEILENVRGADVFVIQSTSYPAN